MISDDLLLRYMALVRAKTGKIFDQLDPSFSEEDRKAVAAAAKRLREQEEELAAKLFSEWMTADAAAMTRLARENSLSVPTYKRLLAAHAQSLGWSDPIHAKWDRDGIPEGIFERAGYENERFDRRKAEEAMREADKQRLIAIVSKGDPGDSNEWFAWNKARDQLYADHGIRVAPGLPRISMR